ncbi:MAG: type VII secretion protein EccB [Pseudonocardiales bacterium]
MPSNPTTKSQVQAYRFMLRRMESALVRKDAVMVHEPMRHHLRASAVGVLLGVLGLAAFFVVGMFKPASRVGVGEIVIIDGTTSVFVIAEGPGGERRLVPMTNLTSARLLVAALQPGVDSPPEPKPVQESALADLVPTPPTGLINVPSYLPDKKNLVGGEWSVCDTADVREDLPNAESRPELSTTVIGGVPRPGQPLGEDQALLIEDQTHGTHYLVWHGRRGQVNLNDNVVKLVYELNGIVPRKVSAGLLNAIPEGDSLNPPDIPGAGVPVNFSQLSGVLVGDVVRLEQAGQESFFLVRNEGLEKVSPAVANLMSFVDSTQGIEDITPADIRDVPQVDTADFDDFPVQVPKVRTIAETPIACLVWQGVDQDPVITYSTDETQLLGEGNRPVPVPGAVEGQQADRVFLERGKAALVRGVVRGQDPETGRIWLVIDQQLYGVRDLATARALGLGDTTTPAPDSILRLLRSGANLDPQEALALYDANQNGR